MKRTCDYCNEIRSCRFDGDGFICDACSSEQDAENQDATFIIGNDGEMLRVS